MALTFPFFLKRRLPPPFFFGENVSLQYVILMAGSWGQTMAVIVLGEVDMAVKGEMAELPWIDHIISPLY